MRWRPHFKQMRKGQMGGFVRGSSSLECFRSHTLIALHPFRLDAQHPHPPPPSSAKPHPRRHRSQQPPLAPPPRCSCIPIPCRPQPDNHKPASLCASIRLPPSRNLRAREPRLLHSRSPIASEPDAARAERSRFPTSWSSGYRALPLPGACNSATD